MSSQLYRDNYPYNIEAPQRVYVQYSQDIVFDYTTGKFPLGETYEGFVWENIYIPVTHIVGTDTIGRHVWMRWRIGESEAWTYPMRITDAVINIETTEIVYEEDPRRIKFKLKYTLNTGDIIYSEDLYIPMPEDGKGISTSQISGNNLILNYTDGTSQNVGRVVGYDGTGVPIGTTDYNILISLNDEPQWISLISQLNNNLSGVLPIIYDNGEYSHSNDDGYRHIPIGGNNGDSLITDGSGTYTWEQRIPYTAIDDLSGVGDLDKLWSADKLSNMFSNLQTFGIKYSVSLYSDLVSIIDMEENDLAVVTSDPLYPNRTVFKYNGVSWIAFFDLDATHNHNTLYYTKTELNTSGAGGQVHWDNITNVPSGFGSWFIYDGTNTSEISDGETLTISAGAGIIASLTGNTLSLSASYIEGDGITISGNTLSHEDTSSVTDTTNTFGQVIQNLEFDGFGHVVNRSNINLDTRYSLLNHSHSNLTAGNGLTGSAYNGTSPISWAVSYAGSGGIYGTANTVARSNHNHNVGASGIITYSYALGQIENGTWKPSSWMKQISLVDGTVLVWGKLIKNGAGTFTANINGANPYPPLQDVNMDIRGLNSTSSKLLTITSSFAGSHFYLTGTFFDGEEFNFSIIYYIDQT